MNIFKKIEGLNKTNYVVTTWYGISFSCFVIIRLVVNTNENPDSSLGVLEHPSKFKRQRIERVDETKDQNSENNLEL